MQTNDLNKLLSNYGGLTLDTDCSLSKIPISNLEPCTPMLSKEELKANKEPISKELLIKVRSDVSKYELLGKSRRWIRRYIKRKYNIVEY